MAKGYPDFFGTSIWPKYGTPVYTNSGLIIVPSLGTVNLISISGNGVLFSLDSYLTAAVDFESSDLFLIVDGAVMVRSVLDPEYLQTSLGGASPVLGLVICSGVDHVLEWMLSREVPFHDSVILRLLNASLGNITTSTYTSHYVVT